jgi:hypothetical protein
MFEVNRLHGPTNVHIVNPVKSPAARTSPGLPLIRNTGRGPETRVPRTSL